MRYAMLFVSAILLNACANPSAPAEKTPTPTAAAPTAEKKGPQCYSGDESKFFDVGQKASVSGILVECTPTSDGKAAQWNKSKS
ncbi:MAG TPA: hypothetical protein VJ001_01750 [Rhodocyclaceae bacterium]|nr:hypothetical protein [Rhodocyclaceae bacterium]